MRKYPPAEESVNVACAKEVIERGHCQTVPWAVDPVEHRRDQDLAWGRGDGSLGWNPFGPFAVGADGLGLPGDGKSEPPLPLPSRIQFGHSSAPTASCGSRGGSSEEDLCPPPPEKNDTPKQHDAYIVLSAAPKRTFLVSEEAERSGQGRVQAHSRQAGRGLEWLQWKRNRSQFPEHRTG